MTGPHRSIQGTAILDRLHDVLTRYVVLPSPEDARGTWREREGSAWLPYLGLSSRTRRSPRGSTSFARRSSRRT
jgi:hypothetical protein